VGEIVRNEGIHSGSDFELTHSGYVKRILSTMYFMAISESRVLIFVWALSTSYLVGTNLHPDMTTLALLIVSGYLLTLGGYVLNAVVDIREDKINSPSKPLSDGKVRIVDAKVMSLVCIASSIAVSLLVSLTTTALFVVCLFLGLAYCLPRVEAKRRFPAKLVVTGCGAAVFSLTGGVAAQTLNGTVFFIAVAFALFALVTLLLGDIADMRGDLATRVRSFPVVVGAHRTVEFLAIIPLALSGLGVLIFRFTNFNILFPILLVSVSCYSSFTMTSLLRDYNDQNSCRRVKSKMRIIHFVLQLTLILGLLPL
jgi:4-hydroxybenzoate polyprenyltransferase